MAADASVTAVDRIRSLRSFAVGAGAAPSIASFGFASGYRSDVEEETPSAPG